MISLSVSETGNSVSQVLVLVNECTHLDWYVLSRYMTFTTLQLTTIIDGYVYKI
jgi:hypothetical protein